MDSRKQHKVSGKSRSVSDFFRKSYVEITVNIDFSVTYKPAQETEVTPSVASKRTGTFGFLSSLNAWSVNNKGENHAKLRR